jgi:hypothetical protein
VTPEYNPQDWEQPSISPQISSPNPAWWVYLFFLQEYSTKALGINLCRDSTICRRAKTLAPISTRIPTKKQPSPHIPRPYYHYELTTISPREKLFNQISFITHKLLHGGKG